jgi:hypothetical protein
MYVLYIGLWGQIMWGGSRCSILYIEKLGQIVRGSNTYRQEPKNIPPPYHPNIINYYYTSLLTLALFTRPHPATTL